MHVPAVLIAAAELLPALKERLGAEHDLLTFADSDALRALEVITTRRPSLVLLEQRFASTPRGTALVNRITSDPSLVDTRVRIVPAAASADLPETATAEFELVEPEPPPPSREVESPAVRADRLDRRGTRRVPRFDVAGAPEIAVDGNRGTLIDIGALGAQIVIPTVLKPNQRVRVSLTDAEATLRCSATVVWASFEIPKGSSPRYRAGLEFIDADAPAVEAYARRHAAG